MRCAHAAILVGFAAIALAIVASGQPTTKAGGFTELHRVDVAGAPDLELVMGLIKRGGESIGAKHHHPGGEFGFVLEGTLSVARENEPPMTLEAGTSFYQPPGEWHAVSTAGKGAKTVVFRVIERGQPMIVAVE